ncbi:MAG: protein-(glutamine-N5) methyltransferase, release factor-specific, partial [Bacteroidota bacterium]
FVELDILKPELWDDNFKTKTFDVIVSNPPYVTPSEESQMKPNVLQYEPHLALFVDDNNPLQFYDAICQFAVNNLEQNGKLYFEINQYLGEQMNALLKTNNFHSIELKKDLFGANRMLKATKL